MLSASHGAQGYSMLLQILVRSPQPVTGLQLDITGNEISVPTDAINHQYEAAAPVLASVPCLIPRGACCQACLRPTSGAFNGL
jgi:hypothetical protein